MKRVFTWQVLLGLFLIALSVLVYFIHYLIFRDAHHIFIYLIGDIAFVFLEVLLVTLVLHQLLQYREKKVMLNKLNMVIGAFFSDVGGELLKTFSDFDTESSEMTQKLLITNIFFLLRLEQILLIQMHRQRLNRQSLVLSKASLPYYIRLSRKYFPTDFIHFLHL